MNNTEGYREFEPETNTRISWPGDPLANIERLVPWQIQPTWMILEPHSLIIRIHNHVTARYLCQTHLRHPFSKRERKKEISLHTRSCVRFTSNAFPLKQIANLIIQPNNFLSHNSPLYAPKVTGDNNRIRNFLAAKRNLFDGQGKYLFSALFDAVF